MFLGIDTSNYTTSAALYDNGEVFQCKRVLSVKQGERGLRQSDAVFQHTVNMPNIIKELCKDKEISLEGIGVSIKPRWIEGSYMPCFLVGESTAQAISSFTGAPLFKTSHQTGHILAALYSAKKLDLIEKSFIAFHISGGTTEAVLVKPDKENIISAEIIGESTDLNAGQAIDRTGVLLGMKFPCGAELEELAQGSSAEFKIKPSVKDCNCSLSGVENKVKAMLENGEKPCDIAKFAIDYINVNLEKMTLALLERHGSMPVLFAGGVSSNKTIRNNFENKFNAYFAEPQFSCDNAAGLAVYAYLKSL